MLKRKEAESAVQQIADALGSAVSDRGDDEEAAVAHRARRQDEPRRNLVLLEPELGHTREARG